MARQHPLDPRSIRRLSMALCFAIAVLIAIVTERIATTTGNKALEDTRSTMDTTRQQAFQTGSDNVRRIATQFLTASGFSVTTLFKAYFGYTTNVANLIGHYMSVQPFEYVTNEQWIEDHVSPLIYQQMLIGRQEPGRMSGVSEIVVTSAPMPMIIRGVVDVALIGEPLNGRQALYALNQYSPSPATHMFSGVADARGHIIVQGAGANETPAADGQIGTCDPDAPQRTNFAVPSGKCMLSMDTLLPEAGQAGIMDLVMRALYTPADPADKVRWMPAARVAHGLSMYTYYIFSSNHPHHAKAGLIQIATNGLQSDSFLHEEVKKLPENSRMYTIEKNPWAGFQVNRADWSGQLGWGGTVVGVSHGSSVKQIPCAPSCPKEMEHIGHVAGTRQYGDLEDPVMREHAVATMGKDGNYTTLIQASQSQIVDWTEANGVVWWTRASLIADDAGLHLYLTMMVPRESVMNEIDAAELSTQQAIDQANKKTDDDVAKGETIMYIVVTVVVLVMLGVSFVFTHMITEPLRELAREMQRVAMLELDIPLAAYSRLAEVRGMQRSFGAMVRNLREFRTFMPASLLHTDQDDCTEQVEGAGDDRASLASRSQATNMSHHSTKHTKQQGATTVASSRSAAVRNFLKSHTQAGLKKKKVSFMVLNLGDTHGIWGQASEHDFIAGHGKAIQSILTALHANKGIPDTFSGDRVLASWNGVNVMTTHRSSCAKGMLQCKAEIMKQQGPGGSMLWSTAAVATGEARCGNMGCDGMKKFTHISTSVTWTFALERLARQNGLAGTRPGSGEAESKMLCDSQIRDETKGVVYCQLQDCVDFPKRTKGKTLWVYQVRGLCEASEDEWMYQLEKGASMDPWSGWNEAFGALLKKDFETAAQKVEAVDKLATSDAMRIASLIRDKQEYPATRLLFH